MLAQDINVEALSANWAYQLHIWPHVPYGSGVVTGSVASCSAKVLATVYTLPGGHLNATIDTVDISVGDVTLHFSGGITAWILDLLKGLLKGVFKSAIAGGLEDTLRELVADDVDSILATFPTQQPLPLPAPYNVSGIDIAVTAGPAFTAQYFGIGISGAGYVLSDPAKPPPFTPPTNLSLWDARTAEYYAQVAVSTFSVQSLFWSLQEGGVLRYTVLPTDVPADFPLQLKTSDIAWDAIAPGLVKAYPDMWVQLAAHFGEAFKVTASEAGNSFAVTLPLALDIQPQTPSGPVTAFTVGCPLATQMRVSVNQNGTGQVIAGSLDFVTCDLGVTNSSVGKVTIGLLTTVVNWALPTLVLPFANSLLQEGFPLPSVDGVTLTNTTVAFRDNYAVLASNLDVNISALPFNFSSTLRSYSADLTSHSTVSGVANLPVPASQPLFFGGKEASGRVLQPSEGAQRNQRRLRGV